MARRATKTPTRTRTKIKEDSSDMKGYKNEEQDEDTVDVFGGSGPDEEPTDEGDVETTELSDSDSDIDDIDMTDVSDDPDNIDGLSTDLDGEEGEESIEDTIASIESMLASLKSDLGIQDDVTSDLDLDGEGEDLDGMGDMDGDEGMGDMDGDEGMDMDMDAGGEGDLDMDAPIDDEEDEAPKKFESRRRRGKAIKETQEPSQWVPQNKPHEDMLDKSASKGAPSAKAYPTHTPDGKEGRADIRKILTGMKSALQGGVGKTTLPAGKGPSKKGNDNTNAKTMPTDPGKPLPKTESKMFTAAGIMAAAMESVDLDTTKEMAKVVKIVGEGMTKKEQEQVAKIFSEAVKKKAKATVQKAAEFYEARVEKQLAEAREGLVDHVSEYLDYVADTYVEANALAIEAGNRHEIAESFMSGMKKLFLEHNITVPEGKENLVEKLDRDLKASRDQLHDVTAKAVKLRNENRALRKDRVLEEAAKGLSESQVEKLKSLAESVDYTNQGEFAKKVNVIRTAHFGESRVKSQPRDFEVINEEKKPSGKMDRYVQAIRSTSK